MQCPQCQQITPDDAAFCGNCGAPLTVGAAEQAGLDNSVAIAMPAESVVTPRDKSRHAIAGFVIALFGLAAWLVPVAGLVIGLLGLILGSIAFHSHRRVFARSGITLSVIVLAASLFMWVHSAQRLSGAAQAQDTNASSASDVLQTVTTSCYSTKVPARMQLSGVEGSCTFQGNDPLSGEQQAVKVLNVPGLSAEGLANVAAADVRNVLKSVPKGRLHDEHSTLFAGSVAYRATITTPDDSGGMIDYVFHPTKAGNLIIVTHSLMHMNADLDIGTVEDNWSWQ
jgi:hypothetical protein